MQCGSRNNAIAHATESNPVERNAIQCKRPRVSEASRKTHRSQGRAALGIAQEDPEGSPRQGQRAPKNIQ
eukprot:4414855-Pyramimonas_sp.AAC.1